MMGADNRARMKLIWILLLPLLCAAGEIPNLTIPNGVGVNIHFVTGHEKDLYLIAAAGFSFVRMDFTWDSIETKQQYQRCIARNSGCICRPPTTSQPPRGRATFDLV
jgi:hypothetical protein